MEDNIESQQNKNHKLNKEEGEDSDDSDFGDFEEASSTTCIIDEKIVYRELPQNGFYPQAPCSSSQLHYMHPHFSLSISNLLDEIALWTVDEAVDFFSTYSGDGFSKLFTEESQSYVDDTNLQNDFSENAFKFWTQIYCVEEMQALNFRWNTSQTYQNFVATLRVDRGYASRQEGKFTENDHQGSSLSSVKGAHSSGNNGTVDSLMVPPANFDWRSSGLDNPLTRLTNSAPFDCNFLVDSSNNVNQKEDSISILERDLQAFGLVSNEMGNLNKCQNGS